VIIEGDVYIGPNASLRGDYGRLILQQGSNLQDRCIMHGYCDMNTVVERDGHIGHGAILHGCVIKRNALVGMNSVVMDGAVIGEDSIVAAMSFVKANFQGLPKQMLMGQPAKVVREVTEQDLHWKGLNTLEYQILAKRSVDALAKVEVNRPRLKGSTEVQTTAQKTS
jgi:carnitine operon protein CaiE